VGTMPSALLGGTGAAPRLGSTSELAAARLQEMAMTTPRQAPVAPAPPPPQEDLSSVSWKLKTTIGLVYDFPDTESLRNWLSSREDLSGYALSHDGKTFKPLREYAHVFPESLRHRLMSASDEAPPVDNSLPAGRRASPKTAMGMPTANSPTQSGPMPARPKPKTNAMATVNASPEPAAKGGGVAKAGPSTKMKTPPRPMTPPPPVKSGGGAAIWVVPAFLLLLGGMIVVILQVTETVDFRSLVLGEEAPVEEAPRAPEGQGEPVGEEPVQAAVQPGATPQDGAQGGGANPLNADDYTRGLLEQARQEISRREYEKAIGTLKSVEGVAPNNPEVYRMLERAHTRLGDREAARQARERLQSLNTP
jgi:hypothetical protein